MQAKQFKGVYEPLIAYYNMLMKYAGTGGQYSIAKHTLILVFIVLLIVSISVGCRNPFERETASTITGKVLDKNGKSLEDVLVSTDPVTTIVKTSNEGKYIITNVPAGEYILIISKAGYKLSETYIKIDEAFYSCSNGLINRDAVLEEKKEWTGEIYGKVIDQDNEGIMGVKIIREPGTVETRTDTNGVFVFVGLDEGTYYLTASCILYKVGKREEVYVKEGNRAQGINIKLGKSKYPFSGSLKGKVTNSEGAAIEGVLMGIRVNPAEYRLLSFTDTRVTDANGDYEFDDILPSDCYVMAMKAGYAIGTKYIQVKGGERVNGDIHISKHEYELVYVPGGTFAQSDSFTHTISTFYIGKYEVAYALWYVVCQWAITNGYSFRRLGCEGNNGGRGFPSDRKNEPVTFMSWRDAIIWCNAYSQVMGKTPVYYTDAGFSMPIKTSSTGNGYWEQIQTAPGSIDNPYVNWNANGYRLPSLGEWQYASRYIDGTNWTPANYASGATANYADEEATGLVAWFVFNSGGKTHDVGMKKANKLGIYDMSGNVSELCWDWYGDLPVGTATDYRGPNNVGLYEVREITGGAYDKTHGLVDIGFDILWSGYDNIGFRLARTQ